ncbi:MAG: hypothetical protein HYY06_07660 [Deltaproteobacteria bacterium]|nr:hypothetical protein [Deltaproteobacteria bacterium]
MVRALLAGWVVLGGCLPSDLEWTVTFATQDLADRAVAVEGSILEGGCEGGTTLYSATIGEISDDPPLLEAGTFGFAGRARNVQCQWYAAGCKTLELPASDDAVAVMLDAEAGGPFCEGPCLDGACGPPGATICEAGLADCNNDETDGCEADLGAARTCGGCAPCEDYFPYCALEPDGSHDCSPICITPDSRCGEGGCTDLGRDPRNCGGCGSICPQRANADPVCAGGACGFACRADFEDCDRDSSNGCEAAGSCG